jgi:hypothetical protein
MFQEACIDRMHRNRAKVRVTVVIASDDTRQKRFYVAVRPLSIEQFLAQLGPAQVRTLHKFHGTEAFLLKL